MTRKARVFAAILVGALILGTGAWISSVQAYEPLCFDCESVPFHGRQCLDVGHGGRTDCYRNSSGACIPFGGHCFGLTTIQA